MSTEVIEKEVKTNVGENEKLKQATSKRNNYIDVLKGIAIICVVLIHTAFHSGNAYVPKWFANFTLLFEVPIFFFLAGWSYSYSKGNKSYLQGMIITQIKYMLFMIMVFIAIKIAEAMNYTNTNLSLANLVNWIFHTYSNTKPFQGVYYSLWFFRVYFIVSLIGATIITFTKPKARKYIMLLCVMGIFIITFFAPKMGYINIGVELSHVLFYLFFYMLGHYTKEKQLTISKFIILIGVTILTLIGINKMTNIDITQIQNHKFLPNFIFMLWSLFGVYIVLFLKKYFDSCKKNILSIIGQHSMYIFFAQGIGSSVLFWVTKYFTMNWYYKIFIMFGINILVTAITTVLLKLILDPVGKWCKKLLEEKIFN